MAAVLDENAPSGLSQTTMEEAFHRAPPSRSQLTRNRKKAQGGGKVAEKQSRAQELMDCLDWKVKKRRCNTWHCTAHEVTETHSHACFGKL